MKLLEVRDTMTSIPVIAIELDTNEKLIRRLGFRDRVWIMLIKLNNNKCEYDPIRWSDRTMKNAHKYIYDNWEKINDKDIIDVTKY